MKNKMQIINNAIDTLLHKKENIIVAVDGNAAAGKSTLAAAIAARYDANVLHMDDFFLTPQMRTEKRLCEVGGNVDYERFLAEVLTALCEKRAVEYVRYNCMTQDFEAPEVILPRRVNIVEGAYSLHPTLADRYDLKIMLKVSQDVQSERIVKRNGATMHRRFVSEWIPKENEYFRCFNIEKQCDIVIDCDGIAED